MFNINNVKLVAALFLLIFVGYGWMSQQIELDFWASEELFTARTFPWLVALGGGIVSILLILTPSPPDSRTDGTAIARVAFEHLIPVTGLLIALAVFSLVLEYLGFLLASTGLLATSFFLLGERRPIRLMIVAISVVLTLYLLLRFLGIHLDPGLLGAAL